MKEKIKLPDGREVENVETREWGQAFEDVLIPISRMIDLLKGHQSAEVYDIALLLEILYGQAGRRIVAILEAVDKFIPNIELIVQGGATPSSTPGLRRRRLQPGAGES